MTGKASEQDKEGVLYVERIYRASDTFGGNVPPQRKKSEGDVMRMLEEEAKRHVECVERIRRYLPDLAAAKRREPHR